MNAFDGELHNRRSIPFAALPQTNPERFAADLSAAITGGARLVAYFGLQDHSGCRLVAVLADDANAVLGAATTVVRGTFPSVTPTCPQAQLFEREIWEQCGVTPVGHPWLRPVRRHPPDHGTGRDTRHDREAYPFHQITGEDVHEVAVGPVHAGIIEPGHFRFQARGEEVLDLEIVLGYQHRGVERLLETAPPERVPILAESIAGDTVIGHAGACCGAIEALARSHKSARAQAIRGIALELERLANHFGDLAAIAGDIAYYPGAAVLGRLRGNCLNMLLVLTGNRMGRGLVRPGGVTVDVPPAMAVDLRDGLIRLLDEADPMLELMLRTASVQARLEGVGTVPQARCRQLGVVGPAARAAEVMRDVRHDHPYGVFRFAHLPLTTAWSGDVFARALVRRMEISRSVTFLIEQLARLPRGTPRVARGALAPAELAVSLEEGWRGEIAHILLTDDRGAVRRHKVVDPSFHNWPALAEAMRGNAISDFPLCNKSFNLSYAGHDL
ncbi:MAG TPA: NADH-quinone oxidoreductase subunit C [Gemmatimonadales bacterium]